MQLGDKDSPDYYGRVNAKFLINEGRGLTKEDLKEGLFFDFQGERILEMKINDGAPIPVHSINFHKHRVYIPVD